MAKLPGAQDLGGLPQPDAQRPVAAYDTSALGRAGAALTEGGRALGQGIAKFGEGAGELELEKDRWDYAKAHSDFLSRSIEIDTAMKADTNYAADDNDKTLTQRYEEKAAKARETSASLIENPIMRERFVNQTQPLVARAKASAETHARSLENNANIAYTSKQGDNFINKAMDAPDDATRRELIDSHNQLVDGLQAKGAITSVQALEMKRNWAQQFVTADILHRADTDPEGVINELRAAPGSSADVTNRILKIEGSGKNPSSSAEGAGQFIKSTWLDVIKRNRPDIAEGRTDEQLLGLRADKKLGREMTDAYRGENEAFLKSKGIEPTPGNQYLAHFLGAGGAAAVLKADPNMPVADVLAKAVGKEKAAQMIAANPTILNGQLAGSVTQWANNKMGGSVPGGGSVYDILPPAQREQMLAHALQNLQKRNVNDLSDFQAKIQDSQAEALATGGVKNPLSESDFIGRLGAQLGPGAYKQYQGNVQLGRDIASVSRLDPMEQSELLQKYQPKEGDGYAQGLQRMTQLKQAMDKANKEKNDDPGGFAIARLPASNDSYRAFIDLRQTPLAKPEDVQAAARTFAGNTLLEQQQVGIPADARKILPKGYADSFHARISKPAEAGGTINIVAAIEQEAQIWGENWPKVYRELAKDAQPVVRVIGSGIKPGAAQILAETQKIPLSEILKDQDAEKSATVKKDVLDAFKPLAQSMTGQEGAITTFNDFRSQGEKLAAYYVMNGKTSSDAATQAFNDLVGHKYDFSAGTYRVPKSVAVSPAVIADGVSAARESLGKMDLKPARDTIGGLSADYLNKTTVSAYARDGVWVTAPDESGLALIYADQAVRKRDGSPLVLSWEQLGRMGQKRMAESRDANSMSFGPAGLSP